jgi:asparagine synthase (glutamine-hydrolysing)
MWSRVGNAVCGIAGFTTPGPDALQWVTAMNAAQVHRGPDGQGVFADRGVALGHVRLAVIDPDGGAQPRVDAATGDALVFNGEIYGYRAIAERLQAQGVALRDRSDTEVLFQLIRRDGIHRALDQIDGQFAFAFRHGATGALHLVRDRFGEKPLHYAIRDGILTFASEATALRAHPLCHAAAPDMLAAFRFMLFEYLPGEDTGWTGIRKLPPSSILTFCEGNVSLGRYGMLPTAPAAIGLDERSAEERLDELLASAVARQVVADVPVGVFLSGGLDSALITALAARTKPDLTAFTVRVPNEGFDETRHAVAVARHLGVRHEVVALESGDLLRAFHAIGDRLGEPLGDSSLLPTWLVCRAARQVMTVALGGDGADELFAGYPNFWLQRFAPMMSRMPPALGRLLAKLAASLPPGDGYMGKRFLVAQLAQGFGAPVSRQSFLWMSPFGPHRMARVWRRDVLPPGALDHAFAPVDALDAEHGRGTPTDRLLRLFMATYLPEDILTKTDRASMFNSLEVRSPFLDRSVAEFALGLPTDMKIRGRQRKRLLKQVALRYLPAEIVHRPKHGFAVPIGALLRGQFREPVEDVLMSRSHPIAGWFERPAIEHLLAEHMARRANHGKQLWALHTLFQVMGRAGTLRPARPAEVAHA